MGVVCLVVGLMGINLYVGEGGLFGCEDIEIIELVVFVLCEDGIEVVGL